MPEVLTVRAELIRLQQLHRLKKNDHDNNGLLPWRVIGTKFQSPTNLRLIRRKAGEHKLRIVLEGLSRIRGDAVRLQT